MPIPTAVIREVLQYETSSHRFEEYATALISVVEGVPVVATSRSWDLGRDGRDARGRGVYVACTLDENIAKGAKVAHDLQRLQEWARPKKVYICSSQPVSELQIEKLAAQARQLLPRDTEVVVHGGTQIADLDAKLHSDGSSFVAERLYPAELDDWRKFVTEREDAALEDSAMRLALVAMQQRDLGRVRRSLYEGLILDRLVLGASTPNDLSASLQRGLRLSKPIPTASFESHIAALAEEGLVERGERIALTDLGRITRETRTTAALGGLLAGREAVRRHLSEALDRQLSDDDFGDVWKAIQERLSELLYLRGETVVASLSAIVEERERAAPESVEEYKDLIHQLASAAAQRWLDVTTREEVYTAVSDMFTQGTGPACEWLIGICGAFVMLCSLGLEMHSGSALRRSLASLELVLDTDVVLSLVGEGEPDHATVTAARDQWTRIGGSVCLVPPVATEVAHHASIAQSDYDHVTKWLPGSPSDRLSLIQNVFVRGFAELLARRKVRPREWAQYIRTFRGRTERDTSQVHLVLTTEERLTAVNPSRDLVSPISARFLRGTKRDLEAAYRAGGRDKYIALDKLQRDAELVAIVAKRREQRQRSGEGSCCLITSARRLLALPATIVKDDPGAPWVLSPAAWVTLLSFVPGVHLSLSAMRSLLYDFDLRPRLDADDRRVLRMIKDAGEYRFGYARRVTLKRRLDDAVVHVAKELGTSRAKVREMLDAPERSEENSAVAASVVTEALREMAVETETERRLRERIAALEAEVARLKK